jgi:hypothetical protein
MDLFFSFAFIKEENFAFVRFLTMSKPFFESFPFHVTHFSMVVRTTHVKIKRHLMQQFLKLTEKMALNGNLTEFQGKNFMTFRYFIRVCRNALTFLRLLMRD